MLYCVRLNMSRNEFHNIPSGTPGAREAHAVHFEPPFGDYERDYQGFVPYTKERGA